MAVQLKDHVIHWRKKIERSTDDDVILNVIRKLSKIPISVELIQETDIEKCVKKLTKRQDVVGEKSLELLRKWQMNILKLERLRLKESSHNAKHRKERTKKDDDISKQCNTSSKVEATFEKKLSNMVRENVSNGKNNSSNYFIEQSSELSKDEYHSKKSQFRPSLYNYEKDKSSSISCKAVDYEPGIDVNEGYNPECPELFPGTNKNLSMVKDTYSGRQLPIKQKSSSEKGTKVKDKKQRTDSSIALEIRSDKKNKPSTSEKKKSHSEDRSKETYLKLKHKNNAEAKNPKSDSSKKNSYSSISKKGKIKMNSSEEFTSSEVRFEDCLGFNDLVIKKKSVKNQGTTSNKKSSNSCKKSVNSSSHRKEKDSKENKASNKGKLKLDVPKSTVKIDAVDIDATLPDIQPNYKPLPQRYFEPLSSKKKIMSNEDAIKFMSSKKEKTAVYSGRRNIFCRVPSLYEICTKILIEHIDAIEHMGGVPYFLVKPIIEKCSPAQLENIENFNPYLLEDTHGLWEIHCRRDYKLLVPDENETWRELYMRASEEREKKLRSITANISASMSKSNPVRQVKLAYVDSVAKPPRDVARKQAKHGTSLPVNHPMKAGPPSKASPKPTAPFINSIASSAHSAPVIPKKPKVAPLMAKTLKNMKMCYRRK